MAPTAQDRKIEVKVEPGSENIIRLVAVPPVKLSFRVVMFKTDGRKYKLKLEGTHENLTPPSGKELKDSQGPTCCVGFKTRSYGIPRSHKVDAVPIQVNGNKCTAELEVDSFEAGFFGNGVVELSVTPDFPFAKEFPVSGTPVFDNPLNVEGLGIEPGEEPSPAKAPDKTPAPEKGKGKGATPGKPTPPPGLSVLLGRELELEPVFSTAFEKSTLRLSIFEEGAIKNRRTAPDKAVVSFEWTKSADDERTWRVGYAESDDTILLTYLETRQESYGYDLRLEVTEETGKTYVVWERARGISFPRPKLKSFTVGGFGVEAEVENVDRSFKLPLELSLWSYAPLSPDSLVQVMTPYSKPAEAEASSTEYFLDLVGPKILLKKKKNVFALLRIPRSLSGTEDYVPVSVVMDYDENTFLTFDDDQLWLESQKKGKKSASKSKKTPKDLATAVASHELDPTTLLTRTPHFGDVSAGVRGDSLLLSFRLVGDLQYWKEAAPAFSIYDEKGETELLKLKASPSETNPYVHEALVSLSDKNLVGKKVSVRGQVTKPETKLWNHPVEPPQLAARAYEGVPLLTDLKKSLVELTDETTYIKLQCHARHIPNGAKGGTVLAFRVSEIVADLDTPILMSSVKLRYTVAKGAGGLCDSKGALVARITDKESVAKLNGPGKFRVEAYVPGNDGKVFSTEVPKIHIEFGGAPRSVAGQLIWGDRVPEDFRKKVFAISDELKVNPQYLMACMAFETEGKFKSNTPGRSSRAVGLIQFIPGKNDELLGKTTEQLKVMPEVEQLDYVQKYFRYWITAHKMPLVTLGDVYACIICPSGIGQLDDAVYYRAGDGLYEANDGLDRQKKGWITKADATAPVKKWLDEGWEHRR
ncbi:MAG: hypothetical protein ACJ8AT_38600 [Hyalangium sp.]|uniref:hypothetical protein n=1 Tax=Hyalangium sp. TaxID=2028555 RepID=UPI003899CB74